MNEDTQTAENMYYMQTDREDAEPSRRSLDHSSSSTAVASASHSAPPLGVDEVEHTGQPPYLFTTAGELHQICLEHDLTIAQVIWENERAFRSATQIREGLLRRLSRCSAPR